MSEINGVTNPHSEGYGYYSICYWRDSKPCGKDEANVARVEMRVGAFTYGLNFAFPGQHSELDQLVKMLARSYERGEINARTVIRAALGVTEPRR